MADPKQEHTGSGDNVGGDKIENHIKYEYRPKEETKVCPWCDTEFDEKPERKGNKMKCASCEKWSGDPNYERRVAHKYPHVPTDNYAEFTRLMGRIDNDIRLLRYEDALKNSEKLTRMCPGAPHGFLYNALSLYYNQSKDEIVNDSASLILKMLELAKEKLEPEAEDDYNFISATIAYNYFYLLRGVLSQIYGFYINDKSSDKRHTVKVFYKHLKEMFTCYRMYPDINFLKTAIDYFYGHHQFAWFEFEPDDTDYTDIKAVLSEKLYKITEKHKGIKQLLEEMEVEILKQDPDYRRPEQRIDFSKITGNEKPITINNLLQDVTIYSELLENWEKDAMHRMENAANTSIDDLVTLIKMKHPTEYNHFRILRDTEHREVYYYTDYQTTSIKRERVDYKLFLFQDTKAKFFKITKESEWGVSNLKKHDGTVFFSSNEAENKVTPISDYKEIPIRRDKKYIYNPQPTYFFPDHTGTQICNGCHGQKYLPCNTCNMTHKIPCDTCRQQGYVNCNHCQSRGNLTCKKCAGSGYVMKNGQRLVCTKGILGHLDNTGCNGSGRVNCLQCDGQGRTKCKNCNGATYTDCPNCEGDRNNRDTFGKIGCKSCRAAGEIGYFNTIRSNILEQSSRNLILDSNIVDSKGLIASKILALHSPKEEAQEIYFKANEQRGSGYDDTTKALSDTLKTHTGVHYEKYPMLILEKIYYEIVPVVNIKFKQTLTNQIHQLSIIDFDQPNASIVFHSEIKSSLVYQDEWSDILGRALFKRSYIEKIDKRNEIVLMIYMAKADWIIEEREKEIIEARIQGMDKFTKTEQRYIFQLMDIEKLPVLDAKYTIFSSDQVEWNVKSHLIKLIAESDGEYESSEKIVFDKISNMIDQNRSKRLSALTAFLTTWQISVPVLILIAIIVWMVVAL
jgi:hypothetical protein